MTLMLRVNTFTCSFPGPVITGISKKKARNTPQSLKFSCQVSVPYLAIKLYSAVPIRINLNKKSPWF